MTTAPYIAVFLLFVALYVLAEARHDYNKIQAGKKIDHLERWVVRAGVVTLVAAVFVLPMRWKALLLLPIGAFGFSAAFRWCLNRMRGKHWAYIAPWSSLYDRFFFGLSNWDWAWSWSLLKYKYHEWSVRHVDIIHRAGRLAYLTEITIVVAAIAVALFTNT